MRGEHGDDSLAGDLGNDTLFGGSGDDWMAGGSGADRFVLSDLHGDDRVADFGGGDKVDLVGLTVLGGLGTDTVTLGFVLPAGAFAGTLAADNGHLWALGDFV